jgi:hypothetical protein
MDGWQLNGVRAWSVQAGFLRLENTAAFLGRKGAGLDDYSGGKFSGDRLMAALERER